MRVWGALLILISTLIARGDDRAQKLLLAGIQEFNAAYEAWDGARFGAAAEVFRQASTNAPKRSVNFYWLGVAEFHRMLHAKSVSTGGTNKAPAETAMAEALKALNTAVKLNERHSESHALLGTLYGMKVEGSLLRAARFGPRVQRHCVKALASGKDNPRVHYLIGTCQFHAAKDAKGRREALRTFLAAEKLFEAEAQRDPAPTEPRWGRTSCMTFIARTYELLGQPLAAAEYYRKVLVQHPGDHLATEGLQQVTKKKGKS